MLKRFLHAWSSRPLAWAALGLALGLQCGRMVEQGALARAAFALGMVLALALAARSLWFGREAVLALGLALLGLAMGLLRGQALLLAERAPVAADRAPVCMEGRLFSDEGPRPLTHRHVYILTDARVAPWPSAEPLWEPRPGKIRVSLDLRDAAALGLLPGDRAKFYGSLRDVEPPSNPGEFDYRAYLQGRDIHGVFSARKGWPLQKLEDGAWVGPRRLAARLRAWMDRGLQAGLKGRELGLGRGIVLGDKSDLTRDDLASYSRSGLADLLAVSGTHFTLALGLFLLLARVFTYDKRWQAAAGLLLGLAYALVTGFEAPVQRAFALFALWLVGRLADLDTDLPNSLAFGALLILGFQPGALWEPGFQLSFCITVAVCTLGPALGRALPSAWPRWLTLVLGATVAAQVALLPLLAFHFHQFCWPALFSSVISGTFTLLILALGLPLCLLGASSPLAAALLGTLLTWVLQALDFISRWMAALPGSAYSTGEIPLWLLAGFLLWAWLALFARGNAWRVVLAFSLPLLLLGLLWRGLPFQHRHPGLTKLWCLDIGQGDSQLLEFGDGRTLLVDGGPAQPDAGAWVVVPALRALGIQRLDWVLATHADADHVGGLAWVIAQMPVGELLWNGQDVSPKPWVAVLEAAQAKGVPLRTVGRDVPRVEQDGPWKILAPFKPRRSARKPKRPNTNAASVTLLVEDWLLLTGDLPKAGEKRLVKAGLPRVPVLKVGHHGSRTSTDPALVRAVKPKLALLSSGRRNTYGHPHALALKALRNVPLARTDLQGCLYLEHREGEASASLRPWREAGEGALRLPRVKYASPWRGLKTPKNMPLDPEDEEAEVP